jgi:hypothetical protein
MKIFLVNGTLEMRGFYELSDEDDTLDNKVQSNVARASD